MMGYFSPLAGAQLPSPPGEGGSTAVAVVGQQEVWGENRLECAADPAFFHFYLPPLFFSPSPLPSAAVGQVALGKPGKSSLEVSG